MVHRQSRRVALTEVDALSVVWHGHYLRFLEEARTEMARGFELAPRDLLARDWLPVVVDYRVECLHAAVYDELLEVETVLELPETALLIFHGRIRGEDGGMRARGHVRMGIRDRTRGLLYRWPPELEERIRRMYDSHGGGPL